MSDLAVGRAIRRLKEKSCAMAVLPQSQQSFAGLHLAICDFVEECRRLGVEVPQPDRRKVEPC